MNMDAFGIPYKYIKLMYKSPEPISRILKEPVFKVNDHNLLILPDIPNVCNNYYNLILIILI